MIGNNAQALPAVNAEFHYQPIDNTLLERELEQGFGPYQVARHPHVLDKIICGTDCRKKTRRLRHVRRQASSRVAAYKGTQCGIDSLSDQRGQPLFKNHIEAEYSADCIAINLAKQSAKHFSSYRHSWARTGHDGRPGDLGPIAFTAIGACHSILDKHGAFVLEWHCETLVLRLFFLLPALS